MLGTTLSKETAKITTSSWTASIQRRFYSDKGFEHQFSRGTPKNPEGDEARSDTDNADGGVSWAGFIVIVAIGSAIWYYANKKQKQFKEIIEKGQGYGEAAIGGRWSLVDHNGVPVTAADLAGKYHLIYFGFTYCPDICPDELRKLMRAYEQLVPEAKEQLYPIMITVDPWRDSVAQLAGYVKEFHPRLTGLTGTPQQIAEVTRMFRVYSSKGPEEEANDYLMDHSIFTYLMDKEGKMMDYYGPDKDSDEIAESISLHLAARNEAPEPGLVGRIVWKLSNLF